MADVETNPNPNPPPETTGTEQAPAGDGDTNDETAADAKLADSQEEVAANGSGEGKSEGEVAPTTSEAGERRSPEGSAGGQQQNTTDNVGDQTAAASDAAATDGVNESAESREVSGADVTETETRQEEDGDGKAAGEETTEGRVGQSDGQGEVEGEGQSTARADDGGKMEASDAEEDGGARNEGEQPPATPTFSDNDDNDEKEKVPEAAGQEASQPGEDTANDGVTAATADTESARSPSLTAQAAAQLAKRLTNTPADGLIPKPQTAHLPAIARGQVRGQQMTSAITEAMRAEPLPVPRQPIRSRLPPKFIRLTTVTVSPARTRPLPHGPSLYYEEPKRPRKVITWEEATNARPPLRIDMEGPTPCTYTPRVKPLNETNAPAFTFGSKCQPEKGGGARTSWSKSWFQSSHVWHNKVDFTRESQWPSPFHYPKQSGLGPRQRTMPEAPSYTFGHKSEYSIIKPGAPKEPAPNEYKRQTADKLILPRGPAFTHQIRRDGTLLWGSGEHTPGPAAYSPSKPSRERPSFTIQGIRREKSHVLGPYSAL